MFTSDTDAHSKRANISVLWSTAPIYTSVCVHRSNVAEEAESGVLAWWCEVAIQPVQSEFRQYNPCDLLAHDGTINA